MTDTEAWEAYERAKENEITLTEEDEPEVPDGLKEPTLH